jgi:hypothetical protein
MRYVTAVLNSYDAAVGRIDPGQTYLVEDDKAERWINAGMAKEGKAPPPPAEPEDDGDEDPADTDDNDDQDSAQLAADAHKLHEEGASERAIAQQLGISRPRVHALLQT